MHALTTGVSVWLWRAIFVGAAAAGVALPGCGQSSESATTSVDAGSQGPPLLSVANEAAAKAPALSRQSADELLKQIKQLRATPFTNATTPEEILAAQRERHDRVAAMATEVIAKTHDQPTAVRLFDDAVFLLMSARLQLALGGNEEQVTSLYADAEALYKRNPESKAAAEAGFVLVNYAHAAASREQSPAAVQEFARLARRFAENFPREQARAASLLMTAGLSCEMHTLTAPAAACYRQVLDRMPNDPAATEARASLFRLELPGKTLQIGGPTIDGEFVQSNDIRHGQPLLVFFWSPDQPASTEWAAAVRQLHAEQAGRVALLNVTVSDDEAAVRAFLRETGLPGTQLFFSGDEAGWNNPIVANFGVKAVPAIWLVGADGIVRSIHLTPATVSAAVSAAAHQVTVKPSASLQHHSSKPRSP